MRFLKILAYLLGGLLGLVYLLNPGAGVIEFIPDNLPFLGNLDEAAAVGLVVTCFQGYRRLRSGPKALAAHAEADTEVQAAAHAAEAPGSLKP